MNNLDLMGRSCISADYLKDGPNCTEVLCPIETVSTTEP